jgi:hypothetical protein
MVPHVLGNRSFFVLRDLLRSLLPPVSVSEDTLSMQHANIDPNPTIPFSWYMYRVGLYVQTLNSLYSKHIISIEGPEN